MRGPYTILLSFSKQHKVFMVTMLGGVGANFTSSQQTFEDTEEGRTFIKDNILVQCDRVPWKKVYDGETFKWEES